MFLLSSIVIVVDMIQWGVCYPSNFQSTNVRFWFWSLWDLFPLGLRLAFAGGFFNIVMRWKLCFECFFFVFFVRASFFDMYVANVITTITSISVKAVCRKNPYLP